MSRCTLWHVEQKSAAWSFMNGFRNARRCGSGFTFTRKSWRNRIIGCSLAARSDRVGYSIVYPPWPMVLSTSTIAWQATHPRPAWASGVCSTSLIGRSIMPLNISAGSWQPPHHFEGFGPITSCMYSIDLRYHWLLNDDRWWAELYHCL